MRTGPGSRRSAVALVAATVLLVQAFLTAWAGAAIAGQPMFDAFGNSLCISNSVDPGSTPAGDHGKLPTCCTLGCSTVSPLLAAPDQVAVAAFAPSATIALAPLVRIASVVTGLDHDPGSPRAPPLHA